MPDRDTEDRILDAAHVVFLRRGTEGARMHEIADEAGVNKALLHYYFRSKDQLARAVFRRALQSLLPHAFGILESDLAIEAKVHRIVELWIGILSTNPFLPGYVLGELTHHPQRVHEIFESVVGVELGKIGGRVRAKLGAQLEEEAAAGRLRPVEPEQFMMNLISLVIFPFAARPLMEVVLGLEGERFDETMRERTERIPEFFLNALRP